MKRSLIIFFQGIIVALGIGTLFFMLWEPHLEGRNAHATFFEIYFKDPFLAYAYIASIPFFVALYQAFKVLRYIAHKNIFSQPKLKALQMIKCCAIAMIGLAVLGEMFILLNESDDRAGGVFMGLIIMFGAMVMASAAAIFERILQQAVDIKSKND